MKKEELAKIKAQLEKFREKYRINKIEELSRVIDSKNGRESYRYISSPMFKAKQIRFLRLSKN
jgi:hypothetical protein